MSLDDDNTNDIAASFRSIRGGKQTEIPGTERTYTAVEQAAEALREADAACKAAKEIKDDRAERLIFALLEAGVRKYKYTDADGYRHTIMATSKTTVKITRGWQEE